MWLLSFLIVFSPQTAESSQTLGALLKARYAMLVGDYEKAVEFSESVPAEDPLAAEALYLKIDAMQRRIDGQIMAPLAEQKAFVDVLQNAMKVFPDDHRFPLTLGVVLVKQPSLVFTHRLGRPELLLEQALELIKQSGGEHTEDKADAYYQLGRWRLVNRDYFDAASAFEAVCELEPDSGWSWFYAGESQASSHQLRKALASYEQFREVGAGEPWGRRPLVDLAVATLRVQIDDRSETMSQLHQLIDEGEYRIGDILEAALKLEQAGRLTQALALVERLDATRLDFEGLYLTARLYGGLFRYDDFLKLAKELLPQIAEPRTRLMLGNFAMEAALLGGQYDQLSALRQMLDDVSMLRVRLAVFEAAADYRLTQKSSAWGQVVMAHGSDDFVRAWRDSIDRFGLDTTIDLALLRTYVGTGDYEGALAFAAERFDLDNPSPDIWEDMSTIYALLERYDESFALFEKLVADQPERVDLKNNYAYFLSLAGRELDKALALSKQALEREPEIAAYLDTKGWILFRQGDLIQAETYIRRSLAASEDNSEQAEHLGDVLAAQGRMTEARRYWSLAMDDAEGRYQRILDKLDPPQ